MLRKYINITRICHVPWIKNLRFACGSGHQKIVAFEICGMVEGGLTEMRWKVVALMWMANPWRAWMWQYVHVLIVSILSYMAWTLGQFLLLLLSV